MTTKTQDITLADIARELAKIPSAQHKCAELLSGLANQLTASTKTKPKPRSADRHREPKRDRHPPGYMADLWKENYRRMKLRRFYTDHPARPGAARVRAVIPRPRRTGSITPSRNVTSSG